MGVDKAKDVNELFTEHTVEELQRIVRQKRTEVEQKKDELRQLVGERHRDIIDASDRILLMKNLTFEISSLIDQLRSTLSTWNQNTEIKQDFSTETQSHELSTAAQLKLMLDIPELIWNHMDLGQHVSSARMCFLGRHLNARLNLSHETHFSHINAKVLVSRAWDSLVHLETAVVLACRRRLCAPPSSKEEICDSLVALSILEDLSLPQVIDEYFKSRKVALYSVLGVECSLPQEIIKMKPNFILPVRKQLSLVVRLISSTLEFLEFLFTSNVTGEACACGGAVNSQITSLNNWKFYDSSTFSKDRLYTHLPSDVLNFKLKSFKFSSDLSHFVQGEGQSSLIDLVQKSWDVWRDDAIQVCYKVLSESLSHVSCFETLVDLRTAILVLVHRLQICTSVVTKTGDHTSTGGYSKLFIFDIWTELLRDLFLRRLEVLFTENLENSFNEWISQLDDLLTRNSKFQKEEENEISKALLNTESFLKNPVDEGQIDWASFVWSDGMRDINIKNSISTEVVNHRETLTASANACNNEILSHLVKSNNVGLVVFCCLAHLSIPNSFPLMGNEKEQDLTSSSHMLVFLQRLISENMSSTFENVSNCVQPSNFGNTDLHRKLQVLLPELQLLCEKLNIDISNCIIKLTSNVGRDSFDIWSLVLSALGKALSGLANWITKKAYGKETINDDCTDVSLPLKISPSSCLLLSRAWYALVDCCPSIIAASIAATGQIESGCAVKPGLNNSTNSTNSVEYSSTTEGLVWANISLLRRGWDSLSQSLFQLVNRITLDSLVNATVEDKIFKEFCDSLYSMFSVTCKKTDDACINDNSESNVSFDEATVKSLLLKYANVDVMSRGIVPFEEVQLELDHSAAAAATEDVDISSTAFIQIPSQLSLPMHHMLMHIVYAMGKLMVHKSLQAPYHHLFLSKVCTAFIKVYSTIVDDLFSHRNVTTDQCPDDACLWLSDSLQKLLQARALQIIFDLKFFQRLLVSSMSKNQLDTSSRHIQSMIQGLTSRLETLVDPFDWNVCASRLNRNVANTITSTYHLYATIIGPNSFSQIETLRCSKSTVKEEPVENKATFSFLPFISGTKSKVKLNLNPLPLNSSVCVNKWSVLRTGNMYTKQI
uniref:Conserved oligomeric Golgi complex subunit 1 n=2 Tax=Trichobilharzia regenti TaxID=157069 RepID=A0AA85JHE3_TRIRE|nr:unnamed protein product [Trichobilharzia regenti]